MLLRLTLFQHLSKGQSKLEEQQNSSLYFLSSTQISFRVQHQIFYLPFIDS